MFQVVESGEPSLILSVRQLFRFANRWDFAGTSNSNFDAEGRRNLQKGVYTNAGIEDFRAFMNVVHVFPYSARVSGGHANAIRSFIACQRAKGINAVGIAPLPDTETTHSSLVFPLVEVDSLWPLRWEAIAQRFQIEAGKSLLHFHSVDRKFTPWLSDLRRTKVPYVFTSHGQLDFQNAGHWFKKFLYLNIVDRSLRNAAGLHLLTGHASRRLKYLVPGYAGRELVQGHLVTIPNQAGLAAALRSDYGISQQAFLLIFLGRLDVATKGLDLLVQAFASLPADRFRLVLVGPDWDGGRSKLEGLADQLGCRHRLHFPGPVYGDRKYALLRMADVFVSPSRHEAFGITLIEAMRCGLPLVTSTHLNLAPDLKAAKAALLAPLAARQIAHAVASLEADPELRQALAGRGKAWAEQNCDPDRAGERFRVFYQSILGPQNTTPQPLVSTSTGGT